jgi:hypothetical protein
MLAVSAESASRTHPRNRATHSPTSTGAPRAGSRNRPARRSRTARSSRRDEGTVAPSDLEHGRVDIGAGVEGSSRQPAAAAEAPPRSPDRAQEIEGWSVVDSGAVAGDLPLHDEVGSFEAAIGMVEEPVQDRRGPGKRRVRHDAVGRARQRNVAHVGVQHDHVRRVGELVARRAASDGSSSIARTDPAARARAFVSAPVPAPKSTTRSPPCIPASATSRAARWGLPRKCWPSRRDRSVDARPGTDHRDHLRASWLHASWHVPAAAKHTGTLPAAVFRRGT